MNQYEKERLATRSPIPYLLLEKIQKHGFITGSKILGGYVEGESDIDYILPPTFPVKLIAEYKVGYPSNYKDTTFDSYYVVNKDREILNLLIMKNQKEFDVWKETTRTILRLIRISPVIKEKCTVKEHRVALFETIKDILSSPEFEVDDKPIANDDIPF